MPSLSLSSTKKPCSVHAEQGFFVSLKRSQRALALFEEIKGLVEVDTFHHVRIDADGDLGA